MLLFFCFCFFLFFFAVESLLIVSPIVGLCNCSMFCCALLYVHSGFAVVLMGKRELVALLSLSSWSLVIVVWLFLAVPWVRLQFVIVVFPDHTHYFFFKPSNLGRQRSGAGFSLIPLLEIFFPPRHMVRSKYRGVF